VRARSGRRLAAWLWCGGVLVATAVTWFTVQSGGSLGPARLRQDALDGAARQDLAAVAPLVGLLEKDPDDLEVVKALAGLGLVADDADATLHWLACWRRIAPDDPLPPRLALEVASRTGRLEEAVEAGRMLLRHEPDPLPVLSRLAPAEYLTGRFEEAAAHAAELVRLGGSRDDDVVLLARCLRGLGRDDEARGLVDPLCRRQPPHAAAAAILAAILREDGADASVVPTLRAAITAAADQTSAQAARFELHRSLLDMGMADEAREVFAEWERFEAARTALVDAYHRPDDPRLRERVVRRLTAAGQAERAQAVLSDLAEAAASPRPPAPAPAGSRIAPGQGDAAEASASAGCRFEDVTPRSGIDFLHDGDATPAHLIQETMGGGVAWIDYDRDDRPDLFCVQVTTPRSGRPGHRLYRNLGDGRFRDVSREAGVALADYGMGVEVGDLDNDGYDDLVISAMGGLRLLHNTPAPGGGRRFADATPTSGLVDPHWATGLALLDADADGLLDLYVANYVETDPDHPQACRDFRTGLAQSCTPTAYDHCPHRIYRNLGGLRFHDSTDEWGLAAVPPAPGLGVVAADLDEDGRCDLYVANDMRPAWLLRNTGSGFEEIALRSGCSHGPEGRLMAGMGVVAADLDGSGRASLFTTNFHFEPNVLHRAIGGGAFVESSHRSGLGGPSLSTLGFGAVALDADLDGRLDLAVANGHVNRHAARISAAAFAQPLQVFLGDGHGRFRDATISAGSACTTPRVGRGLAACDFDGDGLPDLAVTANGEPAALLRNRTDSGHFWIRLRLEGDCPASNRSAIGAKVVIDSACGRQTRFVCGGGSYLSAGDRSLSVGLGDHPEPVGVTVVWPSGRSQAYGPLAPNTAWRLVEGEPAASLAR